jgi:predicted nucleic acid-binding Zn ribbon protein
MPIYVYERPDGSRFEIRQGFNDPHLSEDPETGVPVRRILQPAPIIFKGSGWYKTDSRASTGSKSETKATETTETPKAEKTESGGEKPAAAEAPAKSATETTPTKPSAEAKKAADKIAAAS